MVLKLYSSGKSKVEMSLNFVKYFDICMPNLLVSTLIEAKIYIGANTLVIMACCNLLITYKFSICKTV